MFSPPDSNFCHQHLDDMNLDELKQLDVIFNDHDNEWEMYNWLVGKEVRLAGRLAGRLRAVLGPALHDPFERAPHRGHAQQSRPTFKPHDVTFAPPPLSSCQEAPEYLQKLDVFHRLSEYTANKGREMRTQMPRLKLYE